MSAHTKKTDEDGILERALADERAKVAELRGALEQVLPFVEVPSNDMFGDECSEARRVKLFIQQAHDVLTKTDGN